MMNLGDEILSIDDRKKTSVIVPQWGGAEVFARVMGAKERAKYEMMLSDLSDKPNDVRAFTIRIGMIVMCACDEDMNRLFRDDQFDQVAEKNGDAINLVFDMIDRLNLITQTSIEDEAGN